MAPLDHHKNEQRPVLVTGATGYVAGRLVPLLLASGYRGDPVCFFNTEICEPLFRIKLPGHTDAVLN